MKKILLIGLMSAVLFSCKKEEPQVEVPYLTDDLQLKRQKRALLITGYAPGEASTINFEMFRQQNEHFYGDQLNHLSLTVTSGNGLYNAAADSIRNNTFGLTPPFFVMGNEEISPADLMDVIEETVEADQVLLDVNHKVTENDTAYLIDSKIKFFEDTASNGLFIQTYLVGDVRAKKYNGANLNIPEVEGLTSRKDSASFWARDVKSFDTTETIIANGDPYYHHWMLLRAHEGTVWGTNLGEYWPFQGEFYALDIMGTRDTPIRHVFEKEALEDEDDGIPFEYEPGFLTVVWMWDPYVLAHRYVNSVYTPPSGIKPTPGN